MKITCLILMLCLVMASSHQQLKLDKMRNELGINDTNDIKDKSPGVVFTTIALGSFRGFIANLLFLRSNRLQEERRYYEVHQLAKWIRNLQPRYTKAIAFMAWNMSYNISVTFDTPQERWVWVDKGIDLYLDAIKNHSGDPELYWEFGWLFQHKMGMNLDDANRYYKRQWALKMVKLYGEKPDMNLLAQSGRQQGLLHAKLARMDFKEFNQLLSAYKMTFEELFEEVLASPTYELPEKITKYLKKPEWQEEVVKFIKLGNLKRHEPTTLAYMLDGIVNFDEVLGKTPQKWDFKKFESRFQEIGNVPQEISDNILLAPSDKAEVLAIIDSFMRDRWSWNEYRLDVRKIANLNTEYGALDWRVAETHAIYWAKMGLEKNPNHVQCTRMVSQALKDIVDRGKLLYFSSETYQDIDWTYNVDVIDNVSAKLEENIENLDESKRSTFETGYENFLIDAVVSLFVYNKKQKAMSYYKRLQERHPDNPKYKQALEAFVTPEVTEDLSSMNEDQARSILEGFMVRAYQMVMFDDTEQAIHWWTRSINIYNSFKKRTANRKGRQGWTSTFSVMAERVMERVKADFPLQQTKIMNFYDIIVKKKEITERIETD
jgi:hypothetical protein